MAEQLHSACAPVEGRAPQTASVITDGFYLNVFLNLYLSEEGLLSTHILLRQCPALHSDDYTHLDLQAAQCNGTEPQQVQKQYSYLLSYLIYNLPTTDSSDVFWFILTLKRSIFLLYVPHKNSSLPKHWTITLPLLPVHYSLTKTAYFVLSVRLEQLRIAVLDECIKHKHG